MVFLAAQQSHAFGLGEIQVSSYLGEPLKAQVDLTDLADDYESSLKVRLASPEEYKRNGYAYPYDIKFRFSIVNENGKQPMVRISSSHTIEDPYLTLLLEVSSPAGKIIRDFTFLIDPAPAVSRNPELVQLQPSPKPVSIQAQKAGDTPASQSPATPPAPNHTTDLPHLRAAKPAAPSARNKRVWVQPQRYVSKLDPSGQLSNKLSLSLSTSLSISNSDPGLSSSPKENNDVLQEELIAKEKTLKEMNEQIAEMQEVIKGLQEKLNLAAASGVSGTSGIDSVPVVSQVAVAPSAVVKVDTPVIVAEENQPGRSSDLFKRYTEELFAGLSIGVLGLFGFYGYRKRKLESGWIPSGLFDDLEHAPAPAAVAPAPEQPPAAPVAAAPVLTKKLDVGSQSMKIPAYKEQKVQSSLPAEYDLLEEADIYLRFGHDKLAEEVLFDALKINAANPEIYMTLLGIFDTRGDAKGFEAVALKLKAIGDEATWQKAAEMGRKLDIGNELYA